MKVKHLFYATAGLMVAAACNNEEFTTSGASFDGKGELVELNGAVAITKGGVQTRAIDEKGNFLWMPAGTLGNADNEVPEKIGLCWTGVNNANPDKAPAQTTGSMVYTNYEFVQAGWLYKGETVPALNPCTPFDVKNGEYNAAANIGDKGITAEADNTNGTYKAKTAGKTLDLTTGFFTTKNTAIYSGEYIVYYPYSDEFFDSPIVATAPRSLTLDGNADNKYAAVSEHGFNVGYVGEFQGGQLSDAFVTNLLTGAAYIGIKNTGTEAVTLKQITLYAAGADDNFITKQELSASAIKAAGNVPAKIGANLYLGQPTETSKTIVANYKEAKEFGAGVTDYAYAVLPVLPATISDLKILLVNKDDQVAIVDCGKAEIGALCKGEYSVKKAIDLKDVEFKADYIVTDATSLESVVKSITSLTNVTNPINVQVIGDVTLKNNVTIGNSDNFKLVTFNGGKIIVPADKILTLSRNPKMNTDIDVLDKGCCGTNDGKLIAKRAVLGGVINNRGDIEVGAKSTETSVVMNNATINNLKGTETVRGVEIDYEGTIDVVEKTELLLNGTSNILNEGKITTKGTGVSAQDATITLTQGSTAAIDNQGSIVNGGNINVLSSANGLVNSTAGSEFVDKVGSQLTGYGMNSDNQGEFICEVDAQNRYEVAIASDIRPTTIVRFIAKAGGQNATTDTEYKIKEGEIKNKATQELVSFEVAAPNTDDIKFVIAEEKKTKVAIIDAFTVTSAKSVTLAREMQANTTADFNASGIKTSIEENFTVVEEMNVNAGTVAVKEKKGVNVAGSSDCDLNVAKSALIEFANDGKSYFDVIANNGSVDIMVATVTPKVAHEVWCNRFTTGADGKWANNSYPMIIKK